MTIEQLNAFGANTKEGLARCFGNEALYLKLVNMVCEETNFDKLQTALNTGDLDAAFEAAHALKGVLGNLSLTPMYDICADMTEALRSRTQTDYAQPLEALLAKKDELTALCR